MTFLVKAGGAIPLPPITVEADSPKEAIEKAEESSGVTIDRRSVEVHDAVSGVVYRSEDLNGGRDNDNGSPGEGEVS